jgi:hypothetical protein
MTPPSGTIRRVADPDAGHSGLFAGISEAAASLAAVIVGQTAW